MKLLFLGDFLPNNPFQFLGFSTDCKPVGNLECAFAWNSVTKPKAYPIILEPDRLDIVRDSGFSALSLANNHVYDAEAQAFDYMVKCLNDEASDIQFYGLKNRPFARITDGGIRCAVIGCLERCRSRGPKILKEEDVLSLVREIRDDFDRVFVTPHWGKEGEYAFHPSPQQRKLAKKWINAGVDGVFGHHPHTIHGYENIDGKPVFYSLGNFFFTHEEGQKYPLTNIGLAVECDTKKGALSWKYRFIRHSEHEIELVKDDNTSRLNLFFMHISKNLADEDRPWTWHRWAKAVGPIYMIKSSRSWRIRFKQMSCLGTFLLLLAWNALPKNLLMRLGSWLGNKEICEDSERLDSELINLYP